MARESGTTSSLHDLIIQSDRNYSEDLKRDYALANQALDQINKAGGSTDSLYEFALAIHGKARRIAAGEQVAKIFQRYEALGKVFEKAPGRPLAHMSQHPHFGGRTVGQIESVGLVSRLADPQQLFRYTITNGYDDAQAVVKMPVKLLHEWPHSHGWEPEPAPDVTNDAYITVAYVSRTVSKYTDSKHEPDEAVRFRDGIALGWQQIYVAHHEFDEVYHPFDDNRFRARERIAREAFEHFESPEPAAD